MHEKSYVNSKQLHGIKVYSAKLKKVKTLALYLTDFTRRVFEIDAPLPAAMFVDSKLLSPKEIEQLNDLLEQMEGKPK